MPVISAQITKKEIDYLEEIARENYLYKGDSEEPSIGKAMKKLIEWCQMSDVKIGEKKHTKVDESQKMLEQIHSILPQIMYQLRMQLLFNSENASEVQLANYKQSAINFLNASCGEFQDVQYKMIKPVEDDNGLNKLPIDRVVSKWTAKKI